MTLLPVKLQTKVISKPIFSPVIFKNKNVTKYCYDKEHYILRYDNENGKNIVFYYKKNNKWHIGVDKYWIPFMPSDSSSGIYVGVEGEKNVDFLLTKGITSFTFASHCWDREALEYNLKYLKNKDGFQGFLYVADNDRIGKIKARKLESVATELQIPHQVISIIDIWYYVTDEFCHPHSDLIDLFSITNFNLEKLLCNTIIKL